MEINLIHQEKLNRKKIFIINIISFLLGFCGSLLVYITSAYFKKTLGTENISWIYLVANFVLLFTLLNINNVIRVIGKTLLFYFVTIIKISLFAGLILFNNAFTNTFFLMCFIVFEAISWTLINMILESYSVDKESGKIFGFNLTLINTGFLAGPFISTQILNNFGFGGVFTLAILITSLVFLIAIFNLKQTNRRYPNKINYATIFKKIKERADIRNIYFISVSLNFFYALMVIFTPLYLLNKGLGWQQIGVIFTIMLIPFVLIQYPAGLLADKKFGEKELLFISFVVMGTATLFFYFSESVEVATLSVILLFSRIGAALIETLQASYFYKRIDGDDIDLISFFQTAQPVAYILAPLISSLILIRFPMSSLFLLGGIVPFLTLFFVYKLEDNPVASDVEN